MLNIQSDPQRRPNLVVPQVLSFRTPAQLPRANSSESNQSVISSTDAYPIIRGNGTIRGLARNEETIADLNNIKYGGYGTDEDESMERMAAFRVTSKAVKVEGKKKASCLVLHSVACLILSTSSYSLRRLLPLYPTPPLIA
jgi:hypothetical protein